MKFYYPNGNIKEHITRDFHKKYSNKSHLSWVQYSQDNVIALYHSNGRLRQISGSCEEIRFDKTGKCIYHKLRKLSEWRAITVRDHMIEENELLVLALKHGLVLIPRSYI